MSFDDDIHRYEAEDALERFIEEQLREIAEAPVIAYLSKYGDAIEERIRNCISEAAALRKAGFWGASLIRSSAAIEIAMSFFVRQLGSVAYQKSANGAYSGRPRFIAGNFA